MSTLGIGESCCRNAASIFEKGAFLIWFDDLFTVCYYLQCFKNILIFNTELIFAQDEDGLIIHLSLRTEWFKKCSKSVSLSGFKKSAVALL